MCGTSGCGKTIFCEQYAFEILKKGGKVIWITTEELPTSIREGMLRFGWDVEPFEESRKFVILDAASPARLGLSENVGHGMLGLDPTGMLIVITDQLRSSQTEEEDPEKLILVLDSVSRLLLSCEYKAVIDFVACLNSRLENFRVRGLATVCEGAHEDKALNSLTFSCAGTIKFRIREEGDSRVRQFRIDSLRGRSHDDRWRNYSLTNSGVDIEI